MPRSSIISRQRDLSDDVFELFFIRILLWNSEKSLDNEEHTEFDDRKNKAEILLFCSSGIVYCGGGIRGGRAGHYPKIWRAQRDINFMGRRVQWCRCRVNARWRINSPSNYIAWLDGHNNAACVEGQKLRSCRGWSTEKLMLNDERLLWLAWAGKNLWRSTYFFWWWFICLDNNFTFIP